MSFQNQPEAASFTSEATWLTGPLQNLASMNSASTKTPDQPVFIPFDVNLTAGGSQTCFCESGIPDYWLVTVRPIVNAKVSIYLNPNNSGIPIRLSGGGEAKLPGMSEYLTVLCEGGSANVIVTVLAIRGYKNIELNGGNLA